MNMNAHAWSLGKISLTLSYVRSYLGSIFYDFMRHMTYSRIRVFDIYSLHLLNVLSLYFEIEIQGGCMSITLMFNGLRNLGKSSS